ncbi:MAG: adenylate kinase [SAR202 cluster bacterium]|nr:adenylate kinase [SAR202 cluster bacterium]|tara:strand:+ start:842 stop:1474 length:633 start_codon:yes stop_codon:yes gene_type:complete
MRILLMGAPGSGKGTQAGFIAQKAKVSSVSSGDLFRKNLSEKSELGILAKTFMDRGEYVPDDVTIRMVLDWINDPSNTSGFVLDGFPRTLPQAIALDEELGSVDKVIFFDVPNNDLIERLSGRLICRTCQASFHKIFYPSKNGMICDKCPDELYQRDDDKADVVTNRLKVYMQETQPVIQYYAKQNKLITVDGSKSVDEVESELEMALND